MPKKVVFSLGDPSAEKVLNALLPLLENKDWEFYGITGNLLKEKVTPLGKIEDISATGVFEVLPKLPRIFKVRRNILRFLEREKPQILVAIDSPGFNLPLIKEAKKLGVKRVIYFILPQVWAWKESRKYHLTQYADVLISILPFEREYFKEFPHIEFHFVGHPSVELLGDLTNTENSGGDYFVIFPGSRRNEIKRHLKVLTKAVPLAVKEFGYKPVLLTFKNFKGLLKPLRKLAKVVYLDENPQKGLLLIKRAKFGWIKSGTTALETALLETPHLIFYKTNPLTYFLAKRLVKVSHLHLANLVLGETVVPELLQGDFTPKNLIKTTYHLLENGDYQRDQFRVLKKLLNPDGGSVLKRTAEIIRREMEKF